MKKILVTTLLMVCSTNVLAYQSATTRQNFDGSSTTTYSDGTTSTTRKNFDNSITTRFSDGTTSQSRENFDGSITTTIN